MSKSHYQRIAQAIASDFARNPQSWNVIAHLALVLADEFARDNKLFSRAKFLEACNMGDLA